MMVYLARSKGKTSAKEEQEAEEEGRAVLLICAPSKVLLRCSFGCHIGAPLVTGFVPSKKRPLHFCLNCETVEFKFEEHCKVSFVFEAHFLMR